MRETAVFLPVAGEAGSLLAAFRADPAGWLPAGARAAGPRRWRYLVRGLGLHRPVTSTIGEPVRIGSTTWRTLTWEPEGQPGERGLLDRALPALSGELGLSREGSVTTLVLTADYEVPLGGVGERLDVLAFHRVARATAEAFLEDVAEQLVGAATTVEPTGAAHSGAVR